MAKKPSAGTAGVDLDPADAQLPAAGSVDPAVAADQAAIAAAPDGSVVKVSSATVAALAGQTNASSSLGGVFDGLAADAKAAMESVVADLAKQGVQLSAEVLPIVQGVTVRLVTLAGQAAGERDPARLVEINQQRKEALATLANYGAASAAEAEAAAGATVDRLVDVASRAAARVFSNLAGIATTGLSRWLVTALG